MDPGSPRRRSGRVPGAHPPKGVECISGRGARGARPARHPRRTGGDVDDHPIAPTKPLSAGPHAGPAGRPYGRCLAAAYGPRVEGPDPVDNAGERRIHGRLPQESGFRCGQRPSIHRPHRCRRPKGPRTSGATATPTPGPKPRRGTPRQQRITHGGWCRAQGASTHQTPEGDPSGREGYHCRRAHEVTRQQW